MAILKGIFSMSIIGSIMSFILLLIAPLTKKNFSSSWHYKVSIIILIFFILPIGSLIQYPIPTRIIPNIPPIETEKSDDLKTIVKTGDIQDRLEVQDIEGGYKEDYKDEIKQENYATREARINNNIVINLDIASYEDIILYAWIIGMIALFLLKIIPYIKFKSAILKNSLEVQDTEILSLFNQCKDEFNIDRKIDLRTWHYVGSPMLIGIFNPIILIPNADEDRKVLKMIFLHELNHYKRRILY